MNRLSDARRLFEGLLALRNDVGLLAEEYDTGARRLVGNFPQAFSLVALVNTAHNLSQANKPAAQRSSSLIDLVKVRRRLASDSQSSARHGRRRACSGKTQGDEPGALRFLAANRDDDVLLALEHVRHRRTGRAGRQLGLPQRRTGGLVVGAELPAAGAGR